MVQILINLIAGALGGAATGKSSPTFDLGTVGNIMAAAQSGNLSVGGVISQLIAGGAGGAILTAIIGAIKNKAMA